MEATLLKASVGFRWQEILVQQDMEISLDPDSRKGQLLLIEFLELDTENFWAEPFPVHFLISPFGRSR